MKTAVVLLLFFGVILGLLFGPLALKFNNSNSGFSSQVAARQLSFALISMAACMKLFGDDELMRTREESGGISSFTLLTGKMLGSLLDFVIYPLGFLWKFFVCQIACFFRGIFGPLHVAVYVSLWSGESYGGYFSRKFIFNLSIYLFFC